jgi:hypothetical protein
MRQVLLPIKRLGSGAGGVVYKALHMGMLRIMAVKEVAVMDAQKHICHFIYLAFNSPLACNFELL